MGQSVTLNGVAYTIPTTDDTGWGTEVTNFLVQAADCLARSGGQFTLSAEVNFGSSYGIKLPYIKSSKANIGSEGMLRMNAVDKIVWHQSPGSGNNTLNVASNKLYFNGNVVTSNVDIENLSIVNANISATANISYSKLNLTDSIVDADVNVAAAITRTKLKAGTADYVLVNDAAGNVSEEQFLAKSRGGAGQDMSSVTFPTTGTIAVDHLTTKGDILTRNSASIVRLGVGADGQVLGVDSSEAAGVKWQDPPEGGVNYVKLADRNGNSGTGNWVTFSDGGSLVDGIGGSASNIAISQNTSSPLRDTGSLQVTVSGNIVGEGISVNLDTFDNADLAQPIELSFDYEFISSNYAADDIEVWIYDITNSQLIQPAPYTLAAATDGISQRFKAYWQTPVNSSSYRLIFYGAADNKDGSYDIKIDNIKCGPREKSYGPAITDWKDYIPTSTWDDAAWVVGQWRRVGDSMEIWFKLVLTGTPSNSSILKISLPAGYSLVYDTNAAVSAYTAVGQAKLKDATGNTYALRTKSYQNDLTNIALIFMNTGGSQATIDFVDKTNPVTIAVNDYIVGTAKVPIVGWSSNVEMSNDSDTRVVAMRAEGSTGTHSGGGTENVTSYVSVVKDTHGSFDLSTGQYTVPVAGWYAVSGGISTNAADSGSFQSIRIFQNNTGKISSAVTSYVSGTCGSISGIIYCAVGDILNLNFYNSGSAKTYLNNPFTFFAVQRVSGPAQIAAHEFVGARYTVDTTQSISSGSYITLNYNVKTYDTHNAVTIGADWKFTAPVAGYYAVSGGCIFDSAAWTAGTAFGLKLRKNGSDYSVIHYEIIQATFTNPLAGYGSATVYLNAGETLSLAVYQDVGSSATRSSDAAFSYIDIRKLNQ